MSEQLELFYCNPPPQVDLDGCIDEARNIRYIGKATQMYDGTWRVLASIGGCLCIVQVSIRPLEAIPG